MRDGSQREDTGTATRQIFRTIVTSISEWEWVAAIPYGFKLAGHGKHLAAVPSEEKVLQRIGRERRRGASYDPIADRLNADRIPTKQRGRWYAATGAATGGLLGAGIAAGAGAAAGAAVGGASGAMESAAAGGVSQRQLEANAYGACMVGKGYLVRW